MTSEAHLESPTTPCRQQPQQQEKEKTLQNPERLVITDLFSHPTPPPLFTSHLLSYTALQKDGEQVSNERHLELECFFFSFLVPPSPRLSLSSPSLLLHVVLPPLSTGSAHRREQS